MDKVLEMMARAIYGAPGPDGDTIAAYFAENFRCDATNAAESREFALTVSKMAATECLAFLEKEGYVVVPRAADRRVMLAIQGSTLGAPEPTEELKEMVREFGKYAK